MLRSEIIKEARSYIGVPWKHEGRTDGGLDCVGLIQIVGRHFNIPFEDKKGYSEAPFGREFLNHLLKYLTVNKACAVYDGTVGVFRQNRFPCHVGFFATQGGRRTLIHSTLSQRKVVEIPWTIPSTDQMHLVMALELPGVTDG